MKTDKLVLWFNETELDDIPQVGGKNASLGEMIRELTAKGVNIPDGFAVTAYAYRYLLDSAGIADEMAAILSDLDTHDMHNLSEKGEKLRALIYNAEIPDDLNRAIVGAYKNSVRSMRKIPTWLCEVPQQPKICPMRALQGSRRHT